MVISHEKLTHFPRICSPDFPFKKAAILRNSSPFSTLTCKKLFFCKKEYRMNSNKVLALLFFGVLMGALDISIVGPAIPSISESLRVSTRDLSWIFSIYVLFNLVGISLFAKLSDLYGRRSIYMITLAIFGIGSLVVALSGNLDTLLLGRAIQGFGASGIFPVASAVVGDQFPQEKRGRVLGMIGAVWGIAFIIGPILAGTLLAFFPWHVLFLVNIPIVLILIFFSYRLLSSQRVESANQIDWLGIVFLGLFLGTLTYGVNSYDTASGLAGVLHSKVWPFLLASLLFLVVLFFTEKKMPYPVINPGLFRSRQIRIVGFIAIITGLFQSAFVFFPNLAVLSFGVSSSKASFMLIPFVTATAVGSPIFGRLLDKTGSKVVILAGLVLSAFGLFFIGLPGGSKVVFYGSGILIGLGMSILSGSALRYIMLNEVGVHERAITQGVLTIFISIGQIVGSAAITSVAARSALPAAGYRKALFLMSFLMVITFFLSLRLKPKAQE
jgi:MFS family permease